jgi:hypothetical protein
MALLTCCSLWRWRERASTQEWTADEVTLAAATPAQPASGPLLVEEPGHLCAYGGKVCGVPSRVRRRVGKVERGHDTVAIACRQGCERHRGRRAKAR